MSSLKYRSQQFYNILGVILLIVVFTFTLLILCEPNKKESKRSVKPTLDNINSISTPSYIDYNKKKVTYCVKEFDTSRDCKIVKSGVVWETAINSKTNKRLLNVEGYWIKEEAVLGVVQ